MPAAIRLTTTALCVVAAFVFATARAQAQGGPPMLTDDPGTPGDRHFELNVAATLEGTPNERTWDLPTFDLNYGVGDRIQLNLQTALVLLAGDEHGPSAGPGVLSLAVKWRFLDEGEDGFSISTYPRVERAIVRSSVRRGLADNGTRVLLPFEIAHRIGPFRVDAEIGSALRSVGRSEWIYGVVAGRALSAKTDLMAELNGGARANFSDDRLTVNIGLRQGLTKWVALITSLGHDVRAPENESLALVSYAGFQFEF